MTLQIYSTRIFRTVKHFFTIRSRKSRVAIGLWHSVALAGRRSERCCCPVNTAVYTGGSEDGVLCSLIICVIQYARIRWFVSSNFKHRTPVPEVPAAGSAINRVAPQIFVANWPLWVIECRKSVVVSSWLKQSAILMSRIVFMLNMNEWNRFSWYMKPRIRSLY